MQTLERRIFGEPRREFKRVGVEKVEAETLVHFARVSVHHQKNRGERER